MRCTPAPSTSSPLQLSHRTRNPLFVLDRPPTPNHHARSASGLCFSLRLLCLLRAATERERETTLRDPRDPFLPPRFQDSFQGTDSLLHQPTNTLQQPPHPPPSRPPAIVILPNVLPLSTRLDSTYLPLSPLPSLFLSTPPPGLLFSFIHGPYDFDTLLIQWEDASVDTPSVVCIPHLLHPPHKERHASRPPRRRVGASSLLQEAWLPHSVGLIGWHAWSSSSLDFNI